MPRLPVGIRDVRVAFGVLVGMLLAGVVLPLGSPERDTGTALSTAGGPTGAGAAAPLTGDLAAGDTAAGASDPGAAAAPDAGSAADGAAAGATPDGAAPTAGAGAPADAKRASDQGITPEAVKIGVALVNLDSLSSAGVGASNGTVAQRRQIWEAIAAEVNRRGGAAGRKVELAVTDFNPLDRNAGLQACRRLAEDAKVFAVVADAGWTAPLCVTRQYKLPNIGYDAQDTTTFAESGGLLWTSMATNDRILYNHVVTLHERGMLKGKKIGLVTFDGYSGAYDRTQVPKLRSLGYEITHRSNLSESQTTAQSQIPIEVNQMRSKGVDFIIFESSPTYVNLWFNQALRTGYRPTYSVSDFSSGSDDFSVQAVVEQVDAYAWGTRRKIERRTNRPPAGPDAACVEQVSKATGLSMPRDKDMYWETTRFCAQMAAIVDALDRAGVNPTRGSFASAFSNLGRRPDLDVGPGGTGGSWTPQKPDGADFLHMLKHDVACRCWRPQGEWFPMRPLGG